MVKREEGTAEDAANTLHPLFKAIPFEEGSNSKNDKNNNENDENNNNNNNNNNYTPGKKKKSFYYNEVTGRVTFKRFPGDRPSPGGILAEEMGKTYTSPPS